MTAPRTLIVGLALAAGCASEVSAHRYTLPPPAGDDRVGAPSKRADPVVVSPAPRPPAELPRKDPARREAPRGDVARAIEAASSLIGHRAIVVDGRDYGPGCAALVRAALESAGQQLPRSAGDASSLHALALGRGLLRSSIRGAPGDVAFLSDRPGGPATHAGLVVRVEPDGTTTVLHRVARGVMRLRVNLAYPSRLTDPATGKRLNDTLLVNEASVPAGSLVVGFASFFDAPRVASPSIPPTG
jgi:cell wall-associated NlpC family hydrolase